MEIVLLILVAWIFCKYIYNWDDKDKIKSLSDQIGNLNKYREDRDSFWMKAYYDQYELTNSVKQDQVNEAMSREKAVNKITQLEDEGMALRKEIVDLRNQNRVLTHKCFFLEQMGHLGKTVSTRVAHLDQSQTIGEYQKENEMLRNRIALRDSSIQMYYGVYENFKKEIDKLREEKNVLLDAHHNAELRVGGFEKLNVELNKECGELKHRCENQRQTISNTMIAIEKNDALHICAATFAPQLLINLGIRKYV